MLPKDGLRKQIETAMDSSDELDLTSKDVNSGILFNSRGNNGPTRRRSLHTEHNPPSPLPAKRQRLVRQSPVKQDKKTSHKVPKCRNLARVKQRPYPSATVTATPSAGASLPPEIWRLIGEEVAHLLTLRALISVSRAFHDIFTPLLHARRIINLEYFSKPLNETPLPPYLQYVQDFRINPYTFRLSGGAYSSYRNVEFAAWITRALESMTCLRSFSWRDESWDDTCDTALILRDYKLLCALKSVSTLREVSVRFAPYAIEDPIAISNCYFPLAGFRNLTSLELYDFDESHVGIIKDITGVLCESPFLRKLGLGCAVECDQDYPSIRYRSSDLQPLFFEQLCECYSTACKTGPLALETLRLGQGIFLCNPLWPFTSDYSSENHPVSKLLDVRKLEVLHIYNGLVKSHLLEDPYHPLIDWKIFRIKGGPKTFRQLSVSILTQNITSCISLGHVHVQELIVTDRYNIWEENFGEFYLPPGLSMLWTASFPRQSLTVLGHLPDGGSHLTHLTLALDFEKQWNHFSTHLAPLKRLTHLRLVPETWLDGDYPTSSSSIWPHVTQTNDIARHFGQLIALLCPSIHYIKIGESAWEIIAPRPLVGPSSALAIAVRTRSKTKAAGNMLRALDKDEVLAVEMFTWATFAVNSGLLGPERDRPETNVRAIEGVFASSALMG